MNIGIDIVDVVRFRAALTTPRFAEKVFTCTERREADAAADPALHLALCFAAKEATLKALSAGLFSAPLSDIEVSCGDCPAPRVYLSGLAAQLASGVSSTTLHAAASHTSRLAVAVVLACTD
jgi:phosphopantetheine--protein transferase-like protein